MLGTQLWSSSKVIHIHNCWVVSPAPRIQYFRLFHLNSSVILIWIQHRHQCRKGLLAPTWCTDVQNSDENISITQNSKVHIEKSNNSNEVVILRQLEILQQLIMKHVSRKQNHESMKTIFVRYLFLAYCLLCFAKYWQKTTGEFCIIF